MRFGRIIDCLKSEHVKFLFGLPGAKSVDLYDALYDTSEVRLIHVRHPASAAFMAYASWPTHQGTRVCPATVGPGAHNLVPRLAEADGAFQMYSDEVMTAKQYDAPVTRCVLNSFSLGWIKYDEHLAYGDRYIGLDFKEQPDFTKLVDVYGCFGETVDSAEQVRDALQKAVEANNDEVPAILDFRVDSRFDAITEEFRVLRKALIAEVVG